MAGSGAQLFALAQLTMIAGHHGISYHQFRGAGCQKTLAARLGEDFLLTFTAVKNLACDGEMKRKHPSFPANAGSLTKPQGSK
jgi:hypothetical protein